VSPSFNIPLSDINFLHENAVRALPFEFDIISLQLISNGKREKKLAPFGDDRGNGDAFNCQDLRRDSMCLLCCALDTRESFLSKMTLSRALLKTFPGKLKERTDASGSEQSLDVTFSTINI
jgi:hypothetical protein